MSSVRKRNLEGTQITEKIRAHKICDLTFAEFAKFFAKKIALLEY